MNEHDNVTLAFIGGGNMANALSEGLIHKRCSAHDVLVVEPNNELRETWQQRGTNVAFEVGPELAKYRIWLLAVKPQIMKRVVLQAKSYLQPDTVVISVAAGIAASDIARWFGTDSQPMERVIRCMPNTPAFIACGATGLYALADVAERDRKLAQHLLKTVGEVVWVNSDDELDAVTALSGSGPAYVFLFLEALIQGGVELGLSPEHSRKLALATLNGATQLAALSPESPEILRQRVTSQGGTTAAALDVFQSHHFTETVQAAMRAAKNRAADLAKEFA